MRFLLFLALVLALPVRAQSGPGPLPQAVDPGEVMALPAEVRARFHDEVLAQVRSPSERLARTVRFIEAPDALGVTYEEDATYSVAQTYASRRANCLSFTLLFLALAREAGLDAEPQEIANTLAWHQLEGTIYRNQHVNARVRIGSRGYTVDSSGGELIAGSRPVRIGHQRLLAHYYNNLAMQRMAHGDAATGLSLVRQALEADPSYASLWSNAGVLHVRNGDLDAAAQAYARALSIDPRDEGALLNMISLSRRRGDTRAEAQFRERLTQVQRRDPLHHFLLGLDAQREGDTRQAIRHYQAAIRLYDGEHRFHSALARAYVDAGEYKRAARALRRAHALSEGTTREGYATQLQALRGAPP